MLDVHGLLSRLEGARPGAGGFMAKCPAHQDGTASLKVAEGDEGIVLHCHAGCSADDVVRAIGILWSDLFRDAQPEATGEWMPSNDPAHPKGVTAAAVYDYVDTDGTLLYQVLRSPTFANANGHPSKDFRQRRPDASRKSGWCWSIEGVQRVPYRLPKVIEAVRAGDTIYVVEGEKDVQALEVKGEVATCNSGGAGKWQDHHDQFFVGATVVVVADKDEPGRKHARDVMRHLEPVASSVRIVEAAEGCKDPAEHFAADHGLTDFLQTAGPDEPQPDLMEDVLAFIAGEDHWDWIVPGLLEHRDRLILTGYEGLGKTTMIRQIAVTLSSGVHPFMFGSITPVRVMVVDCENGESFSRRKYRNMIFDAAKRGHMPDEGMFRIKIRTNGLDLLDEQDAAWLNERLTAYGPDVLFIGPLYKLHHEDPSKAQPTLAVQAVLDRLRDEHGCAIVMEAHAGHGGGGFERALRPEGHSSWLRWPEFGYGLLPVREGPPNRALFSQWRGPRDERDWPEWLDHGQNWPWDGGRNGAWPSHALLDRVPVEP